LYLAATFPWNASHYTEMAWAAPHAILAWGAGKAGEQSMNKR
jgi:hypothetical protein